jgi:choice-of-anchor C domain-containing protein
MFIRLAICASASVCLHVAGQENLVSNGSFECATVNPGNTFVRLQPGDTTSVPGWEVVSATVDYISGVYWVASDGVRSFDLDGAPGHNGGIRQTISTRAGATYVGSFDLAGNLHNAPTIKTMTLTIEGGGVLFEKEYEFDITGHDRFNDMGWTTHEFQFVADGETATITLQSTTQPAGWGAAVDNVIIMPEDAEPVCAADCDGSGALNILDFVCFQGLFTDGDPRADVNHDCQLNILDFVTFQGLFVSGCP